MDKSNPLLSVEDAGYRKVCPKDFPRAEGLKKALETGGYEVLLGDDYLYCLPLNQDKKFISLETTISKENFRDWDTMVSSLNFLYTPEIPSDVDLFEISNENLDSMLERFLRTSNPESLYALTNLLFWPHPGQLQSILAKSIPVFFEKYPEGRLHFVRYFPELGSMAGVSRVLTAIDAFGFEVIENPEILKQRPSGLLSRIHSQTFDLISESTVKTLLSIFFRFVYGACVPRLGGNIIVQIDPPTKFELPYRYERWDFNREGGIFESESGVAVLEYMKDPGILQQQPRIGYKRYVFEAPWTAKEFESLANWTIVQLNALLRFMYDLCFYTNEGGFIDFIKQRKLLLTLERIVVEINIIVTEMDPFVRKTLYFNLHDKIASLPDPTGGLKRRRKKFNRLFKPTHYEKVLRERLNKLPEPFNERISLLGSELFRDLNDRLLDSVWARHRVSEKGISMRRASNKPNGFVTEKMQDPAEPERYVPEDFAANLLHEFRNSLHGYQLQSSSFEEFLLMHKGDLPDSLADFGLVWYFLLLADVRGLIMGDWTKGISPRTL